MTENNSEQKENKNIINISWVIPWTAGWLFTFGIGAVFTHESYELYVTWNIFQQIGFLFVSYILWPLILGNHFK